MEPFELDCFYLFFSSYLVALPQMRDYFDNRYKTQKVRFYEAARAHKYYEHQLMKDRPLETEVTMKRAFAILLCSREDEILQAEIIAKINTIYPQIEKVCRNFSLRKYIPLEAGHLTACTAKNAASDVKSSFLYSVAYELYCIYGFETDNQDVQKVYTAIADEIGNKLCYNTANIFNEIKSVKAKEVMFLPREHRNLYDAIQSGEDILDLVSAYERQTNHNICSGGKVQEKEELLKEILKEGDSDYFFALSSLHILGFQFSLNGLSIATYLSGLKITREERELSLKLIAREVGTFFPGTRQTFRFAHYLNTLYMDNLQKCSRQTRSSILRTTVKHSTMN